MVQESATGPSVAFPTTGSLTDDVVRHALERPGAVLFSRRHEPEWHDVTAAAFARGVQAVAKGLMAHGIEPGDRVGLLCRTRYEWTLFDYALWYVGAVTVPVYVTSASEQTRWMLADSGAVACLVETADHRAVLETARPRLTALRHLWTVEEDAVASLTRAGADIDDDALAKRRESVTPDDLATLIYTSGTTGTPRACRLTHAHFTAELSAVTDQLHDLFDEDGASTVLVLPLAHVLARVVQVGCVRARVRLQHAPDARDLVEVLAQARPTFLVTVPRLLEKMFTSASQRAHSEGRGRLFDVAAGTAIDYSVAAEHGRIGPLLRLRHAMFRRTVYGEIHRALGGRLRYAVSGGAPLGERLAHFFRGIGVTVLDGYGLTESTGALTVNTPDGTRIGTVGRPLPGTEVRLSDDGELLFRGPQVFTGYWGDHADGRGPVDEHGWLHTGDLGEVDADGYVHVTGRKTEVLVTSSGKNVSPGPLEEAVRTHPLVAQCMVFGEARPYLTALVTLDPEEWDRWRERHGRSGRLADHVDDPGLVAEVQQAVDAANATVSQAEWIRAFRILPEAWTTASGHLTPTMKLRRHAVSRDFAHLADALYR